MGASVKATDLLIGIGTDLLVRINGVEARLRSNLIGIKPDEFLILEVPRVKGIESALHNGNKLTVIFMNAGTVYGFESSIINAVKSPYRLLFVSYPSTIESHELRKSERINCYLPAEINLDGHKADYDGIILDISRFGCSFNSISIPMKKTSVFQLGAKVHLTFELIGIEERRKFSGKIKNLNLDDKMLSIGVKFDRFKNDVQQKIDAYVCSVAAYHAESHASASRGEPS
jgi:c-di-GMP-binding flagellar brake protein YcgR